MTGETLREEIRAIHKKYPWFYALIIMAIALGIGVGIAASEFADESRGFWMNVVTEGLGVAASVVITVFVIDRVYERRDERRRTDELKRRLVRDAGSRSNGHALAAIKELYDEGRLLGDDGWLKGERLAEADLTNADLRSANLRETDLWKTKLKYADMWGTQLHDAFLVHANLQEANSSGAIFEGADLREADLRGSDLSYADLRHADLRGAKLQGANIMGAKFYKSKFHTTIFPDGYSYLHYSELRKFTNPLDHDFKETLKGINEVRREMNLDPIEVPPE